MFLIRAHIEYVDVRIIFCVTVINADSVQDP